MLRKTVNAKAKNLSHATHHSLTETKRVDVNACMRCRVAVVIIFVIAYFLVVTTFARVGWGCRGLRDIKVN